MLYFLFVCVQPPEQFFSYPATVTITGERSMLSTHGFYRVTPTATRDLGLYGLIQRSGTHVPQWDSNRGHCKHQIIALRSNHCATRAALA
jgi:hypothetical protein